MTLSRRALMGCLGSLAAAPLLFRRARAGEPAALAQLAEATGHDMNSIPPEWIGNEQIALLLYPQFTALDLVAPQYMFASLMGAKVHLVAKTRDPVPCDTGFSLLPTATFEDCPADLSLICVPGGTLGTLAAMEDEATLGFLADRGARAAWVTSVCTGSLLLGAAGLLEGYRATSHWVTRDLLKVFGATPVAERVVRDRNRVTGGGVTAGLDFGLTLVAELRDPLYASALQLLAEYDPAPPFDAGSPEKAGPEVTRLLTDMFAGFVEQARSVGERVFLSRG